MCCICVLSWQGERQRLFPAGKRTEVLLEGNIHFRDALRGSRQWLLPAEFPLWQSENMTQFLGTTWKRDVKPPLFSILQGSAFFELILLSASHLFVGSKRKQSPHAPSLNKEFPTPYPLAQDMSSSFNIAMLPHIQFLMSYMSLKFICHSNIHSYYKYSTSTSRLGADDNNQCPVPGSGYMGVPPWQVIFLARLFLWAEGYFFTASPLE